MRSPLRMKIEKMKFQPGSRTLQLKHEERVFLLQWAKTLKPKTEIEKRIVRRFLTRLMGHAIYLPLYPKRECPVCEREVAGHIYESHVIRCKARRDAESRMPKIDPVVWEMMR